MGIIVETEAGALEGQEDAGLHVFRGIPYARPPVGEGRFRAPEPLEPWSGLRDASAFAFSAPQNPMLLPLPGMDVGATAEDCLYLNVWTPAADGGRRPVLVWVHGGAFVLGSGSQSLYHGEELARRGDVVVVTLNYRLGPLGFLHLAELCPELEGVVSNAGLRDQVAALRWVRAHIDRFGGDPDQVTVFGESAGGMSVGTLLGTPEARGLFRRAIAQSGACHHVHDRKSAHQVAAAFLAELSLTPDEAARKLRSLPVAHLLAAQQRITARGLLGSTAALPFQPVVDGDVLPAPPLEALREGAGAGVSLLTGSTRDEWKLFALMDGGQLDEPGLLAKLERALPQADSGALLAAYRRALPDAEPPDLYQAIQTDRVFRLPAIRLAEAQARHEGEVFMYRFDWASPALGGRLGACHAIELPFVFGKLDRPGSEMLLGSGPLLERLAGDVMDAWLAFARTGDPGHAALPEAWPAYETARRATFVLDAEARLELAPGDDLRAAWDGLI